MSRYGRISAAFVVLLGAFAGGGAQEMSLKPHLDRVASVASGAPVAIGPGCTNGEIYDDGSAEDGYSGEPQIVETFEAVQRFTPAAYPAAYDTVCVGLVSAGDPDLDLAIEVYDDDGAEGGPGTLLGLLSVAASGIPNDLPCAFYQYDISSLNLAVTSGSFWIGVRWNATTYPGRFVCADQTEGTPLHSGFINFNLGDGWEPTETLFADHRAKLIRATPRVISAGDFSPQALEADFAALGSNGNSIFEPGEQVGVAPAWRNDGETSETILGDAFAFSGPARHTYALNDETAAYGVIPPGDTVSCRDGVACYEMSVDPQGGERPATHWDASFYETLSDSDDSTHIWTLHLGDSFDDVPPENLFYPFTETLLHQGVTSGCAGSDYCPAASVTRGQMAIFVLRSLLGAAYTPPSCGGVFDDVPCPSVFADWVEDLFDRGIVSGCGGNDYCPTASVTRAQMAIFMLKGLMDPDYMPPLCEGDFDDVPCPSTFADWIEDLADRGITSGCGGDDYCPDAPISRGQMGVFLSETFGLTLYGP